MTRQNKVITLIFLSALIIGSAIYYWAFIYAFRNYGEGGNWRPLKEYHFLMDKHSAETKIRQLVKESEATLRFADSNYTFSKDGWVTIIIKTTIDTTHYTFRFRGKDSVWAMEKYSTILLFNIADKYHDITPTTIKHTSQEYLNEKFLLFENSLTQRIR